MDKKLNRAKLENLLESTKAFYDTCINRSEDEHRELMAQKIAMADAVCKGDLYECIQIDSIVSGCYLALCGRWWS